MEQSLDWETPNILFRMTEALLNKQKLLRDLSIGSPLTSASTFFRQQDPNSNEEIFKDPNFPLDITSIYNESQASMFSTQNLNTLKKLIWIRPKDNLKPGFRLYDKIDWNDVQYGLLHNSYFLNSLSNLANVPHIFDKILLTKEIAPNGQYKVQFYINGKPKVLTVDEYFPAYESKSWVFSRSTPSEFWVQVMEKAWAKACGNYAATVGGVPSDALNCLIEAPCFTLNVRRLGKERVWSEIINAIQRKYIISSNTLDEDTNGKLSNLGLSVNEPYTVIFATEYKGLKFVKLRNIWVGYEWKGDYSDSSDKWTADLKEHLGYINDSDGTFFMLYDDFCEYFQYTYISQFHKDYNYNYKKFKQDRLESFVAAKFTVQNLQQVYIGLHQKQERFYKKVSDYRTQQGRLLVAKFNPSAKLGENAYEFVGSDYSLHDKLYVTENLQPGEYHVFSNVRWNYNTPCSYVISTYSRDNLEIQSLDRDEVPLDYLSQIITSFSQKSNINGEKINDNIFLVNSLDDNNTGYAILNFSNSSAKENMIVSFSNPSSECVVISGSLSKTEGRNEVYVQRNNSKAVLFEANVNHLKTFSVTDIECQTYNVDAETDNADPVRNFIAKNIESFEKRRLNDDVLIFEFAHKNSVYFGVINENESKNYRIKINFNKISNMTFTINEKIIKNRNYDYFELNITANQNPDFEFTVSLKSFN